jgi:hypothetical protein
VPSSLFWDKPNAALASSQISARILCTLPNVKILLHKLQAKGRGQHWVLVDRRLSCPYYFHILGLT